MLVSGFVISQPPFRVQGRRTAGAGRGDRLPVGVIHHVARGEHPVDGRAGRGLLDEQVSLRVGGKLLREQLTARVVADRHEHARDRERAFRAATAARALGQSALDVALTEIGAAFDQAAVINGFKIRVERLIRRGPRHPALRAERSPQTSLRYRLAREQE